MSVLLRNSPMLSRARSFSAIRGAGIAIGSAALAMAGCSANIARFDNPSFALGESGAGSGTASRRTAGGPVLDAPQSYQPGQAPAARAGGVEVAGLPTIDEATAPSGNVPPMRALAVSRAPTPVQASAAAPAARGQQIDVQQGDTLYAIGKRHGVMIADLMAVNDLKNPNLKPGQKLYLPVASGRATPQIKPERVAAAKPVAVPAIPAGPQAVAAASETYTVKPGDSLYAIAAKHKIKVLDLQRANEISDVRKVHPGMVLKMPAGGRPGASASAPVAPGETVQPETRIVRVGTAPAAAMPATGPQPIKVLNGDSPARIAAVETPATANDATPAASQNSKLRWPAKGRVVQAFGARADGTHNDGVDIAVPAGTDVLAAETGVVAYAGNEVKTYGNLVLIRHDNGWVTAYAYNEKLLVQRGDRVKRGQPIAKAGKSGGAEQPQVHFEVRVGSKPVDPTGYLEKL